MQYYEDQSTGSIYSRLELRRMVLNGVVSRSDLSQRFRRLPESLCQLLDQAELIAALAGRKPGRSSSSWPIAGGPES